MIDEKELTKNAILKTLKYLYQHEPTCNYCEQCQYGYNDNLINECHQEQKEVKIRHKKWEIKIKYLEARLKDVE